MKNWLKELFLSLIISPLAFSAEMPVQALQDGTVFMEILKYMMGENLSILPNPGEPQETQSR